MDQPEFQARTAEFAKLKRGFGKADRFLYVKQAYKQAACQENLGPASYDAMSNFKTYTRSPCKAVMVSDKLD